MTVQHNTGMSPKKLNVRQIVTLFTDKSFLGKKKQHKAPFEDVKKMLLMHPNRLLYFYLKLNTAQSHNT